MEQSSQLPPPHLPPRDAATLQAAASKARLYANPIGAVDAIALNLRSLGWPADAALVAAATIWARREL